jgi:predicted nucleic acid-binding protein
VTRYLVDNSVLQRLPRSPSVQTAIGAILDAEDDLCSCAFTLDRLGYSARSAAEQAEGTQRLRTSFLYLSAGPGTDQIVIDIRTALWKAGKGRAAGVIDVGIAAAAVHSDATVLHYDRDFDHIADAYPRLMTQWIVPRGSID